MILLDGNGVGENEKERHKDGSENKSGDRLHIPPL